MVVGEAPGFVDVTRAQSGVIEPGGSAFAARLDGGRWAAFCFTESETVVAAYLAGLVEVTP